MYDDYSLPVKGDEKSDRLRCQRYLGNEHYNAPAPLGYMIDELSHDLSLAAARNAVEQSRLSPSFVKKPAESVACLPLFIRERGAQR